MMEYCTNNSESFVLQFDNISSHTLTVNVRLPLVEIGICRMGSIHYILVFCPFDRFRIPSPDRDGPSLPTRISINILSIDTLIKTTMTSFGNHGISTTLLKNYTYEY